MKGYPWRRWRGADGRLRAKHDDIIDAFRATAKSLGWRRPVYDGAPAGNWVGPKPGDYLPFL